MALLARGKRASLLTQGATDPSGLVNLNLPGVNLTLDPNTRANGGIGVGAGGGGGDGGLGGSGTVLAVTAHQVAQQLAVLAERAHQVAQQLAVLAVQAVLAAQLILVIPRLLRHVTFPAVLVHQVATAAMRLAVQLTAVLR